MKRLLSLVLCVAVVIFSILPVYAKTAPKPVVKKVITIKLSKSTLSLEIAKTYKLTVAFLPANTTQKGVKFLSSDKNIVAVDNAGKITAMKTGVATITTVSTSNSKITAKCKVTVIKPLPAPTAKPTPTPSTASNLVSKFTLDFEKPEYLGYKTINFDDKNNDKIQVAPQTGFTGNAYKVSIMDQDGGKWFTTGMGLDPKATEKIDFKNLKTVSFKYKSTVEFISEPWIVQLVWKTNDTAKTAVATLEVAFPVSKGDLKTFTVDVPKDVSDKLNAGTNYYLDWVMIGLKDKANEFRSGTFIVDDISFNAEPVKLTSKFTLDFEKPEYLGYKTINFDDKNNDKIQVAPQTGFTGNAYKVSIMDQDGGKWFTTGMGLDPKATEKIDFKNLKTVSFKYKSTVEFISEPWIVQLVWKTNDTAKTAVATLEAAFPVSKGDLKTFTVDVPKEVSDKLNAGTNYYLDWVMIGLKDKANEFRSGTFIVDDISFNGEEGAATVTSTGKFLLDFEKPEFVVWKTINFNEANNGKILIEPQQGFTGNAYKVSIMDQDGGKWFTTGLQLDPKATEKVDFKNLKNVSFKYKSTSEFVNEPWIVQLVWKTNDKNKDEVAKIEVKFPVEKGDGKTFSIAIPEDVTKLLNAESNCYLDWVMFGLKEGASEFRSGVFIVDDIKFE